MLFSKVYSALVVGSLVGLILGFDNTRSDNVAVYYGQNSYGATNSNTANWQQHLAFYCQDDAIDVFPIAFLDVFFSAGGLPSLNMANTCNDVDDPVFSGTDLPNCQFLATDIQTCQSKGKIVTISLGGATGSAGFTSNSQAQAFANTIWNLFLGGSSSTRPFGSAVLDGVDLDIEGGSGEYFPAFVTQIRSLAAGASKPYYVTAAPQCPFPDAYLGSVINAVGFDAVYVQFYNNYCSLPNFSNSNDWDFGTWDNWAKNTSPNKNVKVYIGAPASSTAAGSGYVDAATLASIATQTRSQYSSFGGVMLWDASQAYANGRFDLAIKNALTGGTTSSTTSSTTSASTTSSKTSTTSSKTSTTTTSSTTSVSSTVGTGSCAGVAAWSSSVAYVGGSQVTYGGHLWTAKWWSEDDIPGGVAGDWTDDGACTSSNIATAKGEATAAPKVADANSAFTQAPNTKSAVDESLKPTASSKAQSIARVVPSAKASGPPNHIGSRFFQL